MAEEAVLEAPVEVEVETPGQPTDLGEQVEPETPEGEDPDADLDTPDEPEEDPAAPVAAPDGRKMPDGLKKAISALKTTSPEAAKQIKGLYYSDQEYRAAFPTPKDATTAKALYEELGGAEGVQQIQTERDEWNKLDEAFEQASPDLWKSLAEANPEAFQKNATHVINEFAARSPDQYGDYANMVAVNTIMQQPGVEAGLQTLSDLHSQLAGAPWAQAAIASVVNGIVGMQQKAAQFEHKRRSVDPREAALKQKETQFEQKRRGDFEGNIANQAETYLKEKMQPEIDRVIAGRKVDPEAMKGYQSMVENDVMRRLGEIPGFSNKLEAHYRTGDAKKSVEYIQTQYNRILPEAAKVIAPFLRNIPGVKEKSAPAGTAGRAVGPGEIVLKEMPSWDEVDQSKTTVADMIEGRAVLKNGKKASGWT